YSSTTKSKPFKARRPCPSLSPAGRLLLPARCRLRERFLKSLRRMATSCPTQEFQRLLKSLQTHRVTKDSLNVLQRVVSRPPKLCSTTSLASDAARTQAALQHSLICSASTTWTVF